MSIYISIACLDVDQELIKTIRSAKDNAASPDNIHIGIAFIINQKFASFIEDRIKHYGYSNIKTVYFGSEGNIGVIRGRALAASLYDGQDYFLQIDSHTIFLQDWDKEMTDKFESASKMLKTDKLILTGLPGHYGYVTPEGKEIFWYDKSCGYPIWIPNEFRIKKYNLIPHGNDSRPEKVSRYLDKMLDDTGFAPANRVSAAFAFGNKQFIENRFSDESVVFWEEEILQSIYYMDKGFAFVYYGRTAPILHLYHGDIIGERGKRVTLAEVNVDMDVMFDQMRMKYLGYLFDQNNEERISRYEKYAHIDLLNGTRKNNEFPKKYYV